MHLLTVHGREALSLSHFFAFAHLARCAAAMRALPSALIFLRLVGLGTMAGLDPKVARASARCCGRSTQLGACSSRATSASISGVTLYSNPGITLVLFPGFNYRFITKIPDEVPAEVCPGYKYKDDTILFPCISFGPEFEYKQARPTPRFKCR